MMKDPRFEIQDSKFKICVQIKSLGLQIANHNES